MTPAPVAASSPSSVPPVLPACASYTRNVLVTSTKHRSCERHCAARSLDAQNSRPSVCPSMSIHPFTVASARESENGRDVWWEDAKMHEALYYDSCTQQACG